MTPLVSERQKNIQFISKTSYSDNSGWLAGSKPSQSQEENLAYAPCTTHPTAMTCSVCGENVKQKTCTSVDCG